MNRILEIIELIIRKIVDVLEEGTLGYANSYIWGTTTGRSLLNILEKIKSIAVEKKLKKYINPEFFDKLEKFIEEREIDPEDKGDLLAEMIDRRLIKFRITSESKILAEITEKGRAWLEKKEVIEKE